MNETDKGISIIIDDKSSDGKNEVSGDKVQEVFDKIEQWTKDDEEIKKDMDGYRSGVRLVMNDSLTAFSEHKDFEKLIERTPEHVIERIDSEFGTDMVMPIMKKMTEQFIRVWGSDVIDVYDRIDEKIDEFVENRRKGYELTDVFIKGMNKLSVHFRDNKNLDGYKREFEFDDLTWSNPAINRLTEGRYKFSVEGLYPLINPNAKKPRYEIDSRPNRSINLGDTSDRFDELKGEVSKKVDFFVLIFNNVLDQYFNRKEKITEIDWKSISDKAGLLLTDGSDRKTE